MDASSAGGSILGGIRPARDQPVRADVWVARALAGALPPAALVGGWLVACAGDRVGGGGACLDPGGLGAEAVDDGAGGFGGCAACLVEGEPVLVGQHHPGVGAGEQRYDRDGAAGF